MIGRWRFASGLIEKREFIMSSVDAGVRPVAVGGQSLREPGPAQNNPSKKDATDSSGRDIGSAVSALAFFLAVSFSVYVGWDASGLEWIVPESGLGYGLGIAGGVMLLMLLLYPLRKKSRFMRNWGGVKHWFRAHMIMGVAGPVLIAYHSNFSFGSMNSNVALLSMLTVAGSGLVGRYLYSKVHRGLYGREVTLKELRHDLEANMERSVSVLNYAPVVYKRLLAFDADMLKARDGAFERFGYFIATVPRSWRLRLRLSAELKSALKEAAVKEGWQASVVSERERSARAHLGSHISAAVAMAVFGFYERTLALWHLFHFPLFIMLVLTAIIHVVAVHMY